MPINAPYDPITCAQAIALKAYGASVDEITTATQIPPRTVNRIFKRAVDRGYQPGSPILTRHVKDAPRSSRLCLQDRIKEEENFRVSP